MLTAISGGIGSGKSVVARMLQAMGYEVYDCDSRARRLIDNSDSIKQSIARELGACCIATDGSLNRKTVSDIVFSDAGKLGILNAITHAAVRDDLAKWNREQTGRLKLVETAILYQSGIDRMVDAVIEVAAPIDVRVERIERRNGLERDDIIRRIESQNFIAENPHHTIYTILNDDTTPILPQLQAILSALAD